MTRGLSWVTGSHLKQMCLCHVPDLRTTWTFLRGTPTLLPFPWVMILHPDPTPPSPHRLARLANLITADWSTTEPASPPPQATECSERESLASYQDIRVSFPPNTLNFSCRVKTPKEILTASWPKVRGLAPREGKLPGADLQGILPASHP